MGCYKRCYLRQWCTDVSDLHGLKHIAGEGSILRRLLWSAFTLAALGIFILQATLTLISYSQNNHVTTVDVTYATELDFPAVTVCNFNKYRESAWTARDLKNAGTHLGIIDEDHNLINPYLYTEEFRQKVDAVDWSMEEVDVDFDMEEFTNRTGHQFDDMVIECSWRGEPCPSADFNQVYSHLGNCYTFNHVAEDSERLSSISSGAANGLKLTMNIEEEEYTPSNDLDGAAEDAGIKWMLHHPSEPPYVKELGNGAGPGHHTFVAVRHEQITSLPYPYTECEVDGTLEYYSHYSLQACRIDCETRLVVEQCGCRLVEQPGDAAVCNPEDTHECAHVVLLQAITGHIDHPCVCYSPCELENYPFTTTNVKLRANFMQSIYSNTTNNFTADYIENNFVLLSIYFEALSHETIEQLPEWTIPTLLASLGGNFGLFLGASVLTVVQIFEYLFDEMFATCACSMSSKRNRVGDSNANLTTKEKAVDDGISIIDIGKDGSANR